MYVSIDRLKKEQKILLEYEDTQFQSGQLGERLSSVGPLTVKVVIQWLNSTIPSIFLKGTILGKLNLVCDRCTEQFEKNINFKVEDYFELDKEEIKNKQINIDTKIKDLFLQSLPIKILCKKTCKGFCVNCKTNLNKSNCKCKNETC